MSRFSDFLSALKERGTKFLDRLNRGSAPSAHVRTVLQDAVVDTYNGTQLLRGSVTASRGVLVQDALLGPDTDEACLKADGQRWSYGYAMANKKEHPNCTREFIPLSPADVGPLDKTDDDIAWDRTVKAKEKAAATRRRQKRERQRQAK